MSGFDERLRNERPAKRRADELLRENLLPIDRLSHRGKPVDDLTQAAHTIVALAREKLAKRVVGGVHEIPEEVYVAAVVDGGDLDARNKTHSGILGVPCRFRQG